jgi:hypothetical protein
MTATEELIAKQVSDVFLASVDDLPLADAARRGLIAPLRCLRPAGCRDQLGADHRRRLRGCPGRGPRPRGAEHGRGDLYRERFGDTPGSSTPPAWTTRANLATAFRAAGVKAEAVSGRTPPVARRDPRLVRARRDRRADQRDAPRRGLELAARDRRHAPRADRVEARIPAANGRPCASTRARRRGSSSTSRRRRDPPRASPPASLLDADFYREGARVTPAPRRRVQRRARRS